MSSVSLKCLIEFSLIFLFCSANNLLASTLVMSCETKPIHNDPEDYIIYEYSKNWLGRKSIRIRRDDGWQQWCRGEVTPKQKELGVISLNDEKKVYDMGGSCKTLISVVTPDGQQYEGKGWKIELNTTIDFIALTRKRSKSSNWQTGDIKTKESILVFECEILEVDR